MMSHDARVQKIVDLFRSNVGKDWPTIRLARIGELRAHVVALEFANAFHVNEVWVRIGHEEYRGSAEKVAKLLCTNHLAAPSRAVSDAAAAIKAKFVRDLKAYELAAVLGLEDEITFSALDNLAECGIVREQPDRTWAWI